MAANWHPCIWVSGTMTHHLYALQGVLKAAGIKAARQGMSGSAHHALQAHELLQALAPFPPWLLPGLHQNSCKLVLPQTSCYCCCTTSSSEYSRRPQHPHLQGSQLRWCQQLQQHGVEWAREVRMG